MITQRRLRHLLSLVEYAHFGRAAAALNISQPALTKSIQALEAELGVMLLDRKRGAVVLTAFGELVVQRSRALLNAEEDLLREITLLAGLEIGSLRVALGPYPSVVSGYPAMARLLARRPKITVAVHVAGWREVARRVSARDVDLGLAELSGVEEDDQFATELVGQHRGRIFCRPGHPILAAGRVALPALLEFPWMASRLPARIAAGLPRTVGRAGRIDALSGDFIPAITIDVPMQIADLLAGSDTLAFASLALMEHDLAAGNVTVVPTSKVAFQANYGFIRLKDRSLTPAALAYMDEVRAVEAGIAGREAALAERYGYRL
ncbi:LysR family transcriptional regulator [Dechloromonas sp. H13]|uniref:LysR family transcriptional regulator n=1 Tax=Dechloromonas sp. H13 TaxID=2570193 RepID=UPI001D188E92|nr:LysR family transcriptional regulator [Dechloromonas sp. H13]